jgi:hypothetical protein
LQIAWKQASLACPVLFHAEVVVSIGYVLLTINGQNTSLVKSLENLQAQYYGHALQLLRQDVADPNFQPTEGHLLAIALLACQDAPTVEVRDAFPRSPVANLQNNYNFSRFPITVEHITAFYKLVSMRGGIDTVRSHAVREVLEA